MFSTASFIRRPVVFALVLVSALLLVLVSGPSMEGDRSADNSSGLPSTPAMQRLVVELIAWIGEHSDYDVDAFLQHPPRIAFCDCGDTIVYEGRPIIIHEAVKGIYDKEVKAITLVRPWSREDLFNISTLLHELVHFVQYEIREWNCWHQTEWQAYKLQDRWLAQHGIESGFNWTEIYLLSRCTRRDVHP